MEQYLQVQTRSAEERRRLLPGWLGMWRTELGDDCHRITSLYHWESYEQRDESLGSVVDSTQSARTLPLPATRDKLSSSRAYVMVEATETLQACGLGGALGFSASPRAEPRPAWELRTYRLHLGYSTVPKFLELYGDGLRDKLSADDSGASTLVTLLYSDVGPLNMVVELWRHESLERSLASRQASRAATKWRAAIGEIAAIAHTFDTQYIRPLSESPWQ